MKRSHLKFFFFLTMISLPVLSYGSKIEDNLIREGPRIDSVEIINRNIYNTDSSVYKYFIFKLANKFHIKTRKFVIARELLLKKGDLYSKQLADETERNLRSLPFIWDARVELIKSPSGEAILRVTTTDRWTFVGGPAFSRASGRNIVELRLVESNFLGRGQFVSLKYYIRQNVEDYNEVAFTERRLFGTWLRFDLFSSNHPEVGRKSITFTKPLYALTSRFYYGADYTSIYRRERYYSHGDIIAQNYVKGKEVTLSSAFRTGTYNDKVQIGFNYYYNDHRILDLSGGGVEFPQDSIYHLLTPSFSISSIYYIRTTHINTFMRPEDIGLTNGMNLALGWAYDPRRDRQIYRTLSVGLNFASHQGSSLFFLNLNRQVWFDRNLFFRKAFNISIRYYNNGLSWITPVLFATYGEDMRIDRINTLFLGENNGIRGYPENFDSGEKLLRCNFENRLFTGISLLSVNVGAVQFFDFGQSRRLEERFNSREFLWSTGVGLRLGTEKVSDADVFRIDVAYAGRLKTWQISMALGQYLQ
ncbi:exported hypothetical protein [Candidatus Zixiibacteriota bacterium]|nr:exported hypothetical protein [candidate division Zixibacteria bacterium]